MRIGPGLVVLVPVLTSSKSGQYTEYILAAKLWLPVEIHFLLADLKGHPGQARFRADLKEVLPDWL